jgi:hypothetical protein
MKRLLALLVFLFVSIPAHAACDPAVAPGHDYQVGPNAGQLTEGTQVPWENLGPGDTARFFDKQDANGVALPYHSKFAINGRGTATAPIKVCGVPGPNGERPTVDANGALTRSTMSFGRDNAKDANQSRGIFYIGSIASEVGVNAPAKIVIDGLRLINARPGNTYTDAAGAQKEYSDFGAAVWVEYGTDGVTVSNSSIDNSTMCMFSRSQDGSTATVSKNITFAYNDCTNYGIVGDDHEHGTYIQSETVLYEGNHMGQPIPGAYGNAFKDRSVGTVGRFNWIEGGTFGFDLVEAEDWENYAMSKPAYHAAFIYGNHFDMSSALAIHYGGGVGDPRIFRKGTLWFWNNTVRERGKAISGEGAAWLFRISTTDETVQAWNNIFYCDDGVTNNYFCSFRSPQDVQPPEFRGGNLNLGVNWMTHGCGDAPNSVCDGDGYHDFPGGTFTGASNLIAGLAAPLSLTSYAPTVNGPADNSAQAQRPEVAAYPVDKQIDAAGHVSARASVADLGAIESSGVAPPPTCPTLPAPLTRTQTCTAPLVGAWQQTATYSPAAYPVCSVLGAYLPTTAPAGACTTPPPPPLRLVVTVKQGTVSHTFQADASTNSVTAILVPRVGTVALHWRVSQGADVFNFANSNALTWTQQQVSTVRVAN